MPNFPNLLTSPCLDTSPPPPDNRCSDPSFVLANPGVCAATPILIIKPGVLLTCVLGSVQFRAFLEQNGVESQPTSGVVFSSSNPDVAIVGAISGNTTGIAAGTVTISATYQGITATASLTILGGISKSEGCCGGTEVATVVLIDTSKSMSLQFGGNYATKEDFAKALAAQYVGETNYQKDLIATVTFDSTNVTLAPLIGTVPGIAAQVALIQAVLASQNLTGIGQALLAAIGLLSPVNAQVKNIVLLTDGEDHDTVVGNAPIPIAASWKNGGGILTCVGIRAHDTGYNLLNTMATGGFFLNAYPAVVADVLTDLSGLKGYICAGNCAPAGDTFINKPVTNYTSLKNWTIDGTINLFGPGLYDVLPGNGLYLNFPVPTSIISKSTFQFMAGKTYRIAVVAAGNQVTANPTASLLVQGATTGGSKFSQTINVPDFMQQPHEFAFNFTPQVTFSDQLVVSSGISDNAIFSAPLVLEVSITDVTDSVTMFDDTFNDENLTYVPPACGTKRVGYGGGGNLIPDPPILTLVASGNTIGAISDPAAPAVAGNISSPVTPPASDVQTGLAAGGSMENGLVLGYFMSYVTASGETTADDLIGSFQIPPFNPSGLNSVVGIGPLPVSPDSRVISKNIYRSTLQTGGDAINRDARLWATIGNSNVNFPGDTESNASWVARAGGLQPAPTSNTTGGSPGFKNPGDTYSYAVSWATGTGQTALSPTTVEVVPADVHSLIVTLPGSVPASVTQVNLWRSELFGPRGPGLYLYAQVPPAQLTVIDLDAHFFLPPNLALPPTTNTTGSTPNPGSVDVGTHQYAVSYQTNSGETKLSPDAFITIAAGYTSVDIQTVLNPDSVTAKRLWRFAAGRYYLLTILPPATSDYIDIMSNAQFIAQVNAAILPPASNTTGTGMTYFTYYGYNCYGAGCLSEPPGNQVQDPNPLPDIETGYVPPTNYTSTKSFCAACPAGLVNAPGTSLIPAMTDDVTPSGVAFSSSNGQNAFHAFSCPGFDGTTASVPAGVTLGLQPFGAPPYIPFNVGYQFPAVTVVSSYLLWGFAPTYAPTAWTFEGSLDGTTWVTLDTQTAQVWLASVTPQSKRFAITNTTAYSFYRIDVSATTATTSSGIYQLVMFGAAAPAQVCESATATSTISQADADAKATAAATIAANDALNCVQQYTSHQSATVQCPIGQFGQQSTASANATSFLSQSDADAQALLLAQAAATAQLDCTKSNNTAQVTIVDAAPATPYPSVQFVSGLTGTITKVIVNIIGFQHTSPVDVAFFLMSPTGQRVLLFSNLNEPKNGAGFDTPITGINLTFDNAASGALPQHSAIVSGTFKPTQYGVSPAFGSGVYAPAPTSPYASTLAAFNGQNGNGSWALWVADFVGGDSGKFAGGWTVTVTSV